LDQVFPVRAHGLREVPSGCWPCGLRVECLKQAVAGPGGRRTVAEEQAARDEARTGGVGGFVRRWSRLKSQSRKEG
jgi:hypothetical protein